MTEAVEHPTIFSGASVRALRAKDKTQTRRVLSARNTYCDGAGWRRGHFEQLDLSRAWVDGGRSPAGNPGPYLHAPCPACDAEHRVYPRVQPERGDKLWVREAFNNEGAGVLYEATSESKLYTWRSPIFMPRNLCRLVLRVPLVRLEHLHDITEEDAIAEGVDAVSMADVPRQGRLCRRDDFAQLWDIINGKRAPYDSNPWVLVYDQLEAV